MDKKGFPIVFLLLLTCCLGQAKPSPTDLFLRGYSVLPSPQRVTLQEKEVIFDETWVYEGNKLLADSISWRSLKRDLQEFHSLELTGRAHKDAQRIILEIAPGTVNTGQGAELDRQAYRLTITKSEIRISGNQEQGLFYGVQTFLQLLKPDSRGRLILPAVVIEDWPAHPLRFLHWDTKHHQDRLETLKRYLDWSSRFKVNMIGFELEDKFEYPSHPIIGAPGAFTTAELQEIVNYGLERFIQVVPQVQSPAHMGYVLKHPEFAELRSDGSNYQVCMCDPKSYELIFSMYDDAIKASRGVQYFFVSTDEVYYAGVCAKCSRPYNPENRSRQWAEFAAKARDFLAQKNRRMLAWIEYPFQAQHLQLLPKDIIDGVMGSDPKEVQAELDYGMDHLAYTSLQGVELLFPNHFPMIDLGQEVRGRLESAGQEISRAAYAKPIGVYGAAWDDSGLHSETFWLGWATVAQYGWAPAVAPVEQTVADFMNIYYGPRSGDLVGIYFSMQKQARVYENSWDRVVSRVRGPAYGDSDSIGPTVRHDLTLPTPPLPQLPGLDFIPVYGPSYQERIGNAAVMIMENERLAHSLVQAMSQVSRNRYSLEVFLSLVQLMNHQNRLLLGMQNIENSLASARQAAFQGNTQKALGQLSTAHSQALKLAGERKTVFADLQRTWEISRYPKGREVNGRKYLHVMDDVKDHFADRRPDLSYLIAPEESMGLDQWIQGIEALTKLYMEKNKLPVKPLTEWLPEGE